MRFSIFVVALLLSGCALFQPKVEYVSVPEGHSPTHKEAAEWRAAQQWKEVKPGVWVAPRESKTSALLDSLGRSVNTMTVEELDEFFYTLIGGDLVPSGQYENVVKISVGNSSCSATVVGPRALLTAGHCADHGDTGRFALRGKTYSVKFTQSPLYRQGKDHDLNMGLINQQVGGITFATVGDIGLVDRGSILRIMGYGCTQPGGSGHDGKLRTGLTQIIGFNGYDAVCKMSNGAANCFGDSGGPNFDEKNKAKDPFIVVGVNSKGNIKDTSYQTLVTTATSRNFMAQWAKDIGTGVCGVTMSCRAGGEQPTPPGNELGEADFGYYTDEVLVRGWYRGQGKDYADNIKAIAIDAVKRMKKQILEIYPQPVGQK